MTELVRITPDRVKIGDFDSDLRFIRRVASGGDARFSTGETFDFNSYVYSDGYRLIRWRYRNGPVQVTGGTFNGSPPAIDDTSFRVKI